MKLNEINIRDPFVLSHGGKYYLYGTRGADCWGPADGFDVYVSEDLKNWQGPHVCFHNDGSFWADRNYWAPEVHVWKGGFYMFASFKNEKLRRGTAILRADTPLGPFRPHSDGRVTPPDWECLDGTFYVSNAGRPYMVFCHEWVQAGDGEVCAMPLTEDLKAADGEPRVIFRASDAPWSKTMHHSSGVDGCVTDGPFLWRTEQGTLECLWAGFSESGYTEGVAVSDNGDIDGHFTQADPIFTRDGGHGMVFRARDGQLYLALHSPNRHLEERPFFHPLREENGLLAREDSLPEWYAPLAEELDSMAERLDRELTGQPEEKNVFTPEECGFRGGLATGAIQQAIDRAAVSGGGRVVLSRGEYVSGTLVLRSGVCLEVAEGAALVASGDLRDFPEHHAARLTVQDTSMGMHQSLIFAEGCENIGIAGRGMIDGRGTPDRFPGAETAQGTPGRPFLIRVIDCRNVHIRDITLKDSPCWMQNYLNCERLLIENIRVYNHANFNNDGLDLDGCRDVIVRGCVIHSGDDALCFKGASQRTAENVLIENCELLSACNALKVGTDTQGDFRRILVRNCVTGGLSEDPSGLKHPCADSAVSLEMLDGGTLEEVLIRDITVTRAWSPFFARLEDRGRVKPGDPVPGPGVMRRIAITGAKGTDNGPRGSYFIGIPERAIEEILLCDIDLCQQASQKPVLREEEVDELRGVYPDAHMIDTLGDAPAYGLWARHVHGLMLKNVHIAPVGEEKRPEYVLKSDVTVKREG